MGNAGNAVHVPYRGKNWQQESGNVRSTPLEHGLLQAKRRVPQVSDRVTGAALKRANLKAPIPDYAGRRKVERRLGFRELARDEELPPPTAQQASPQGMSALPRCCEHRMQTGDPFATRRVRATADYRHQAR